MNIGIIGLGRMGSAIAHRLQLANHTVFGFDTHQPARINAQNDGITCKENLHDVCKNVSVLWLMLPAGAIIDDVLNSIKGDVKPGTIIIDGGNSFYQDSVARAKRLEQMQISFLDCGTSGGLHGKDHGFSLMIGGNPEAFEKAKPAFEAIAAPQGIIYAGPSGAGHFVKTVHNGIEYALLQAYGEGFHLLKEGPYKDLNLQAIASAWNHGSVIRSWILELAEQIFIRDQNFSEISGAIGENLTGQWTVKTAKQLGIPVTLIEDALKIRAQSRETGGNYATKLVALLRNEFGGHEVKKL